MGSSLVDFLKEEGFLEEARAAAVKEALAQPVLKAKKKGAPPDEKAGPSGPAA